MKKILHLTFILLCLYQAGRAQQTINGKVLSSSDLKPLPGASVKVKNSARVVITDSSGRFQLAANELTGILVVSYVGFETIEIPFPPAGRPLEVLLQLLPNTLNEVVVSTGYQQIPKERASGSFVQVDNELLNRSVSTDILSRLQDVVPGLTFNRVGTSQVSIRGQSTIYANSEPLIVLDNFPYDGDVRNINPNDIESITVLKDAAAASIWGAKAGNGVIVINTKRGRNNSAPQVSANSNLNLGEKPDLYYQSRMSTSDFIEMEKLLFSRGYYQSTENSVFKSPLTPVIELLIARRDGKIATALADQQIEELKNQDVRNDLLDFFYRGSANQQYGINLKGGSETQRYYLSGGYDKNLPSSVGDDYSRVSLNASNTYSLLQKRLDITSGILFTETVNRTNGQNLNALRFTSTVPIYPYAQLVSSTGDPLTLTKDFRNSFVQSTRQLGLLDWTYNPIAEIGLSDNSLKGASLLVNTSARYKFIEGISAEVLYQYGRLKDNRMNFQHRDSYSARNLINQFSSINPDGTINRPIPVGSIVDRNEGESINHNLRGQLNYSKLINSKNHLSFIVGSELKDLHYIGTGYRLYGYDDEHARSSIVDYMTDFPLYYFPASTARIQNLDSSSDLSDRFLSWYGNGSYTFGNRFFLTGSARLDKSNLFGVNANQKGVPLWSAGLSWNVYNEPFYKLKWLPYLKLSATYGYNGNVDKSVSAFTTARLMGTSSTREPYAQLINPPNPELRWEKVKMANFALDFESVNSILSGRLEFYLKNGVDLLGNMPLAPSTGATELRGNTASTQGRGIDIVLNSRQIDKVFKWHSTALFSYVSDKVVNYGERAAVTTYLQGLLTSPLEGRPLYSIYSYQWAGLDPATGDPLGLLDGQPSKDYTKILTAATPDNIAFHGPARPTYFGSLRNTFSYKGLSVSANISYRLGYYFRKNSVNYNTVLNGQGGHGDYSLRWQNPGDELHTSVPSRPLTTNNNRDNFYLYSDALVYKGDHIRFRDINLSYSLKRADLPSLPVNQAEIYFYANNLGLLYRANNARIDPDNQNFLLPRTWSLGIRLTL